MLLQIIRGEVGEESLPPLREYEESADERQRAVMSVQRRAAGGGGGDGGAAAGFSGLPWLGHHGRGGSPTSPGWRG